MPTLHRTIVRPMITEKTSAAYQDRGEYTFEVHPRRDEAADPLGDRAAVRREGHRRLDVEPARQGQAHGQDRRPSSELEEGDREAP